MALLGRITSRFGHYAHRQRAPVEMHSELSRGALHLAPLSLLAILFASTKTKNADAYISRGGGMNYRRGALRSLASVRYMRASFVHI
jgi:hypothetical protein